MLNYLLELFNYCGYIPSKIVNNSQLLTNEVRVPVNFPSEIVIAFPGYKSIRGNTYDYRVSLNGIAISHENIMNEIYHHVKMSPENYHLMEALLRDISQNWENINLNKYSQLQFVDYTLGDFVECICYISVQEEINYPRQRGYDGYKRPFYSYLEAIYAANGSNCVSYEEAIARCRAKKQRFQPLPGIPYSII